MEVCYWKGQYNGMKFLSWNVNGIRSVQNKGFEAWFKKEAPDFLCVQEIKAYPEQLDVFLRQPAGYQSFWAPAEKAGYSGVAVYTKHEPLDVSLQMGFPEADNEGRVLQLRFKDFVLINSYFPNSQRDHARLGFKLDFCGHMLELCNAIRGRGLGVVLCGDFNIAHREIDLRNPKTNRDNAGFLPEERAWMDRFIDQEKYIDCFRRFETGGGHYTWWSYRPGVREKNVGWRLDYFCVSPELENRLESCVHHPATPGSDHCPVEMNLKV